jgi:hypothetical protein
MGIEKLAARLGAQVTAIGINPLCITVTEQNVVRFLDQPGHLSSRTLSVLEGKAIEASSSFDVVYSWGCLVPYWRDVASYRQYPAAGQAGRLTTCQYLQQTFHEYQPGCSIAYCGEEWQGWGLGRQPQGKDSTGKSRSKLRGYLLRPPFLMMTSSGPSPGIGWVAPCTPILPTICRTIGWSKSIG